ncbi:hypothetical protein [Aquimarina sp. AU119]|uniref:hypothetical protein n=1 Tax=Aquimarina sp. AU119 TaxID=2108528 RepID=UPI000D686805|nr:hypothetical protein [Aquimarina sp. AU119]
MNLYIKILLLSITTSVSCQSLSDEKTMILLNQENNEYFPYSEFKVWKPNKSEIKFVKSVLKKAIEENKSDYDVKEIFENYDDYYLQLTPYLNKNNDRIVFISAFCDMTYGKDWKNYIIDPDDGGSCFWQIQINIDNEKYFDLSVNGF